MYFMACHYMHVILLYTHRIAAVVLVELWQVLYREVARLM